MILIDTSGIIEWARGSEKGVRIAQEAYEDTVAMSAVSVNELSNGKIGSHMHTLLKQVLIIPFDSCEAIYASKIETMLKRKGEIIQKADAFIAGTAMAQDIPLITCDKFFKKVPGLKVIYI